MSLSTNPTSAGTSDIGLASDAISRTQRLDDLLNPYRGTPSIIRLPLARLLTHPRNRDYRPNAAQDLTTSFRGTLNTREHPAKIILSYRNGQAVPGETASDAFSRLATAHPDAVALDEDLSDSADVDLKWLFDVFEVSLAAPSGPARHALTRRRFSQVRVIAGQHRSGALRILGEKDPDWLRIMWPCVVLLPGESIINPRLIKSCVGHSAPGANLSELLTQDFLSLAWTAVTSSAPVWPIRRPGKTF